MKSVHQKGFTIIELLIATAVFSTILLVCTFGLIAISRTYYKGVTSARTQEVARNAINDISQSIQFSGGTVTQTVAGQEMISNNGTRGFCAGNKRYSYVLDRQLRDTVTAPDHSRHVLVVDDSIATCSTGAQAQDFNGAVVGKELLGQNMRLASISIVQIPNSSLYNISLNVIYGDVDLLTPTHTQCELGIKGTEFCSSAPLSTTVEKRVE